MIRTSLLAIGLSAVAAPSVAQAPEPTPALAPAASVPADPAVEAYYATHANALIWLKDAATHSAAGKLPATLRRAEVDGLANSDLLASEVESALLRGQLADDKLISSAWVKYVKALRSPVRGMSYGDPALAPSPASADSVLKDAAAAPSLAAHVETLAAVNPLYTTLRDEALKQGAKDDPRVKATLERLRIVPAKGRAILVDSASARLWMLEDGRAVDEMKVIVGRTKDPTPLIAGTIHYVTLNPYWNIPTDVAQRTVAPLVLKRGVKYLKAARYVTADGFGKAAGLVEAADIDWKAVAAGDAPVHIRQLPGGNNMMGAMKFGFVNDYDIFLHDTPRRQLFDKAKRTLSLGCIRLEHADRLARWMLGRDAVPDGDAPEQHIQLDKGMPVYVTYLTASVEDGQLTFADDVYGLDPLPEPAATETEVSAATAASDVR